MKLFYEFLQFLNITPDEFTSHLKLYFLIFVFEKALKGIIKLLKLAKNYFTGRKHVSENQLMPFDVIMLVFEPQKDALVLAAVVRLQLLR